MRKKHLSINLFVGLNWFKISGQLHKLSQYVKTVLRTNLTKQLVKM